MKLKIFFASLFILGALFAASDAKAFSVKADQSVYIPADETVEGNLYAAGQNMTVDGNVTGDIICAGQNVIINGSVGGDVICAAQALSINGDVGGNVRAVGNVVNIDGLVGRNVTVFGASAIFSQSSEIDGDVLVGAAGVEARGTIAGELHGGGASMVISGEVGKDVNVEISANNSNSENRGQLIIGAGTIIGGNVYYHAAAEGVKFVNDGTVIGEVKRLDPRVKSYKSKDFGALAIAWIWANLIRLLGALLVALAFVGLFGNRVDKVTEKMFVKPASAFGWGIAVLFLFPILFICTLFTVIGIPAAVVAGLVWFLGLLLAKVFVSIASGKIIMEKILKKSNATLFATAALGVVVCYILFAIPFLGGLLGFLAVLWGAGGLWIFAKEFFARK